MNNMTIRNKKRTKFGCWYTVYLIILLWLLFPMNDFICNDFIVCLEISKDVYLLVYWNSTILIWSV